MRCGSGVSPLLGAEKELTRMFEATTLRPNKLHTEGSYGAFMCGLFMKSCCTTRYTTTLSTKLDLHGLSVVQIWSRGGHVPLIIEGNETFVVHRVV